MHKITEFELYSKTDRYVMQLLEGLTDVVVYVDVDPTQVVLPRSGPAVMLPEWSAEVQPVRRDCSSEKFEKYLSGD